MDDEVQWREGDEDGKLIAEVNGWTVVVKPSVARPGEWRYSVFATCPTCGIEEGMGGGVRHTLSGAQAEGIALARSRRPKYMKRERGSLERTRYANTMRQVQAGKLADFGRAGKTLLTG